MLKLSPGAKLEGAIRWVIDNCHYPELYRTMGGEALEWNADLPAHERVSGQIGECLDRFLDRVRGVRKEDVPYWTPADEGVLEELRHNYPAMGDGTLLFLRSSVDHLLDEKCQKPLTIEVPNRSGEWRGRLEIRITRTLADAAFLRLRAEDRLHLVFYLLWQHGDGLMRGLRELGYDIRTLRLKETED